MTMALAYEEFVARNSGYVSAETQAKIRKTRLLIAGCGIGSSVAICAARMGFENFVLVDGDVVDGHNLNRQFYDFADIGQPKALALRDHILRINPNATIETIYSNLDEHNTDTIVNRADIVFDTIDFLDLPAIIGLHMSAKRQLKPVFTALSVGFGALVWYFPIDSDYSFLDMLKPDISPEHEVSAGYPSYVQVFSSFVERIAPFLDTEVVEQVNRTLKLMRDGTPCPASQVAVGSFAIGAMAQALIHDLLAGRHLPAAPNILLLSLKSYRALVVTPKLPKGQTAQHDLAETEAASRHGS